jgi:hypothetical protein
MEAAGVSSEVIGNDALGQIVAAAASGLSVDYNPDKNPVTVSGTYNRTGSRTDRPFSKEIELSEKE